MQVVDEWGTKDAPSLVQIRDVGHATRLMDS